MDYAAKALHNDIKAGYSINENYRFLMVAFHRVLSYHCVGEFYGLHFKEMNHET